MPEMKGREKENGKKKERYPMEKEKGKREDGKSNTKSKNNKEITKGVQKKFKWKKRKRNRCDEKKMLEMVREEKMGGKSR